MLTSLVMTALVAVLALIVHLAADVHGPHTKVALAAVLPTELLKVDAAYGDDDEHDDDGGNENENPEPVPEGVRARVLRQSDALGKANVHRVILVAAVRNACRIGDPFASWFARIGLASTFNAVTVFLAGTALERGCICFLSVDVLLPQLEAVIRVPVGR